MKWHHQSVFVCLVVVAACAPSAPQDSSTTTNEVVASDLLDDISPSCDHMIGTYGPVSFISGTYSTGGGFTGMTLIVHADATYEFFHWGCLGEYENVEGEWRQEGAQVLFTQGLGILSDGTQDLLITREGAVAVHNAFSNGICMPLSLQTAVEPDDAADDPSGRR